MDEEDKNEENAERVEEMEDVEFVESDEEGDALSQAQKLKKLREELKVAKTEAQEYLNGWQRARADYSNIVRQLEETKIRAKSLVEENLFSELITVLDSFYYAFNNKEAWEAVEENWRRGVEYVYSQLKGILEARGLSSYEDIGLPFDPLRHQAVSEIETDEETKDTTIAQVLKPGYLYKENILRPATVSVYKFKK